MSVSLLQIFKRLNKKWFNNQIQANVVWGDLTDKLGANSKYWGFYYDAQKLIVINKYLNPLYLKGIPKKYRPPENFLEYIVYHEMLHQFLPPKVYKNGKRSVHHKEFRKWESKVLSYKDFSDWFKTDAGIGWTRHVLPYGLPQYFTHLKALGFKNYKRRYHYWHGTVLSIPAETVKLEILALCPKQKTLFCKDDQGRRWKFESESWSRFKDSWPEPGTFESFMDEIFIASDTTDFEGLAKKVGLSSKASK